MSLRAPGGACRLITRFGRSCEDRRRDPGPLSGPAPAMRMRRRPLGTPGRFGLWTRFRFNPRVFVFLATSRVVFYFPREAIPGPYHPPDPHRRPYCSRSTRLSVLPADVAGEVVDDPDVADPLELRAHPRVDPVHRDRSARGGAGGAEHDGGDRGLPHFASGTPKTATSRTPGCWTTTSSMSRG